MKHSTVIYFMSRFPYSERMEAVSPQSLRVVCKGAASANRQAVNSTVQSLKEELGRQKVVLPRFQTQSHRMSKFEVGLKVFWDRGFVRPGRVVDTVHFVAKKSGNTELQVGYKSLLGGLKVLHRCCLGGDLSKVQGVNLINQIVSDGLQRALLGARQVVSKQREMLGREKRAHPTIGLSKMLRRIV